MTRTRCGTVFLTLTGSEPVHTNVGDDVRIGMKKTTKTILIIAILAFCGWWWLQSWVAYRHVDSTTTMNKAEVAAWYRGICDMNRYMTFRHYPVFLCCAVFLGILGLIPEVKKDQKKE